MKKIARDSLIVSCQALEDEPLHGSEIMAKMAIAAKIGGAKGIRANSPEDVKAIREAVDLPIIGLWKREIEAYDVYITPTYKHAYEILKAGADYIAIDCTSRPRPEPLTQIFKKIRDNFPDKGIVADIATVKDARAILPLKPDFISTTMSGYTKESRYRPKPDIELVRELKKITDIPILAEGNYQNGIQGAKALRLGAYAVVIGGAITRPQKITLKIAKEMENNLKQEVNNEEGISKAN